MTVALPAWAAPGVLARPEVQRVLSNVVFSANSFVVMTGLALELGPAEYAPAGVGYVAGSVATNLIRYGLFDATLAGMVERERCREAARLLALVVATMAAVGAVLGLVAGHGLLTVGAVLGSALAVGADLGRMVRLCDGRSRQVLWGDLGWLGGTAVGAASALTLSLPAAAGALAGWLVGGVWWTGTLRGPVRPGWSGRAAGVILGTWSMAVSGGGPFIGYLVGLLLVGAAGEPSAVSVIEVGRMVGMPALIVYSGLRIGLVAPLAGRHGPSLRAALAALAVAAAVVGATVAAVALTPLNPGSALAAGQRHWLLIWFAQSARLVSGVISDIARPSLSGRAGLGLGGISVVSGAILPPAMVLALGAPGGLLSQLLVAVIIGIWAPVAARRARRRHSLPIAQTGPDPGQAMG